MNHLTEELVDALGAGDDSTVDALDEARIRSTINVDSEAKRDTKALLKGKNGLLLRKLYKNWLRQNRGSGGFKEFKKALQAMLATTASLPESFWDAEPDRGASQPSRRQAPHTRKGYVMQHLTESLAEALALDERAESAQHKLPFKRFAKWARRKAGKGAGWQRLVARRISAALKRAGHKSWRFIALSLQTHPDGSTGIESGVFETGASAEAWCRGRWAQLSDVEARLNGRPSGNYTARWAEVSDQSYREAEAVAGDPLDEGKARKRGPSMFSTRKSGDTDAVHGSLSIDPANHPGIYLSVQGAGSKRWEFTMNREFASALSSELRRFLLGSVHRGRRVGPGYVLDPPGQAFGHVVRGMQEDETEADEGELHEGSGVAATILKQLGGTGRLVAMIGAHTFIDHGNGVSFKWKARTDRPSKRGNYLKIALRNDEYDLTFQYLRGYNSKVVKELRGIQASNLKMAIERQTGLRLSL